LPSGVTYGGNSGTFVVLGSHTYTGDTINGESEGVAGVTVVISHDNTAPQTVNDTATIIDPPVQLRSRRNYVVTEGSATVSGTLITFSDPGGPEELGDYSASIDWRDGQITVGTITGPDSNGIFTVSGTHTYVGDTIFGESEGRFRPTITVHHESAPPL